MDELINPVNHRISNVDFDRARDYITSSGEDPVKEPSHYKIANGLEAKDIIKELLGPEGYIQYCYGNIIKYVLRAKKKQNFMQDLNKAKTYIEFIGD